MSWPRTASTTAHGRPSDHGEQADQRGGSEQDPGEMAPATIALEHAISLASAQGVPGEIVIRTAVDSGRHPK
jgi:hypothetical protein